MDIVIDGNDGTGKSTLVKSLCDLGFAAKDRGVLTKMTDDPSLMPTDDGSLYIILDVPIETSRERLAAAGKDLSEKYHTVEDLTYYRAQFLLVAARLRDEFGPQRVHIVDSSQSAWETLSDVLRRLP